MIRPEQIPDYVVEAAAKAIYEDYIALHSQPEWNPSWEELDNRMDATYREVYRHEARAAIAAALNAWPESHWVGDFGLHLPIPSEGGKQKRLGPEFEAAIFSDVDSLYEADKSGGDA
jgi:hypothetical protein